MENDNESVSMVGVLKELYHDIPKFFRTMVFSTALIVGGMAIDRYLIPSRSFLPPSQNTNLTSIVCPSNSEDPAVAIFKVRKLLDKSDGLTEGSYPIYFRKHVELKQDPNKIYPDGTEIPYTKLVHETRWFSHR